MRRKDRELTDRAKLEDILRQADVCRIALSSETGPYIVPLNFGFEWKGALVLYFHCANEGRKLELMRRDDRVGFEVDVDHELVKGETACKWGMKYRSVIGQGRLLEVGDEVGRRRALDAIMSHYGFEGQPAYNESVLRTTTVLRLEVETISGKQKP